jgi:hypothetical protein
MRRSLERRLEDLESERDPSDPYAHLSGLELIAALEADMAPYFGGRVPTQEEVKAAMRDLPSFLKAQGFELDES